MITIKDAIVMLLMRKEFSLIPTEEAIQSMLFYANYLNVKYNNSLLWNMDEPDSKWIMHKSAPWCYGITKAINDSDNPIVKKNKFYESIGYYLPIRTKAPKMNVEYERILNIIMKDFDIKKWARILSIWRSYPVNQILKEGDEVTFNIK